MLFMETGRAQYYARIHRGLRQQPSSQHLCYVNAHPSRPSNDGQGRCPTSSLAGGVWVRLPTVSPVDVTLFGASTRRRFAARDRYQRQRLDSLPLWPLCYHCGHRRRARYLPSKRPTTATAMPSPRPVAEALLWADAGHRGGLHGWCRPEAAMADAATVGPPHARVVSVHPSRSAKFGALVDRRTLASGARMAAARAHAWSAQRRPHPALESRLNAGLRLSGALAGTCT